MYALFAQAGKNVDPNAAGALGAMMGVLVVVILVALAIGICYLLTLSKALSRCSRESRTMEPGMVWLNLIPLFNIVWQFITVSRVSESLKNEFEARGIDRGGDYGRGVGTAYCVLNLLGIIPIIGVVAALAGLVCFIMYWVKVAGFSGELAREAPADDFDDRPRRRRRDDEADEEEEEDRPRRAKKRRDDDW